MPVSPDMAEQLAKELAATYAEAERRMLEVVARRLERGIDTPGWADAKLAQTTALRRELERIVADLADLTAEQVTAAINRAYAIGQAAGSLDLEQSDRALTAFTPTGDGAAVRVIIEQTLGTLSTTFPPALRVASDTYRDIVSETVRGIATGTQTRRQAAQAALDRFAQRGITGFTDAANRRWDMASYAEMALRTSSGRAAVTGHIDKLSDMGQDLVIVSDAPEECELCRPWEGKVLSISGLTSGYPSVREATSDGLFHPNCRHSLGLYVEGFTRKPTRTADPEGDRQRQQQRYLERKVREWKRREAAALDPAARARSAAKVREWQAALRVHVETHDRKRLRYREQIGSAR